MPPLPRSLPRSPLCPPSQPECLYGRILQRLLRAESQRPLSGQTMATLPEALAVPCIFLRPSTSLFRRQKGTRVPQ